MVLVTGWLRVEPANRSAYLDNSRAVITQARSTAGCLDFHLSADPLEVDRINVFESWESLAAVEAFRGDGVDDPQASMIVSAQVFEHEIASTIALT